MGWGSFFSGHSSDPANGAKGPKSFLRLTVPEGSTWGAKKKEGRTVTAREIWGLKV